MAKANKRASAAKTRPAPKKSAVRKKPAPKVVAKKPAKKPAPKKLVPKKPAPKKPATAPLRKLPKAKPRTRSRPVVQHTPPLGPPTPAGGGARVVEILEDEHPVDALRRFLSTVEGRASTQQGQVALGSAQLMLLPIARGHRGGQVVKDLLDLVLARWSDFPDGDGFHAQEFLRNAFAAVGDDPERMAKLVALVPADASAELRFNIACAYAVMGTRAAMLQALGQALEAGATPSQIRRDEDFTSYVDDPDFVALLEGAGAKAIPVDIKPHMGSVRSALDSLVATLKEYGEQGQLNPGTTLDNVLATEKARKIQLPNDYRALLTLTDGMKLWDNEFFGTRDYRGDTTLAKNAREYLEMSAGYGATGIDECIPLANWGQPSDWLLYDPRGLVRRGEPGYVLMLNADEVPLEDLVAALQRLEEIATDILSTN